MDVTVFPSEGYAFSDFLNARINNNIVKTVYNDDNSITLSYTFPETDYRPEIVNFAGYEWYVIGNEDWGVYPLEDSITLFAKMDSPIFDSTSFGSYDDYRTSSLLGKINNIYNGLSSEEKGLVNSRTLDQIIEGNTSTVLEDQYLWPLSRAELEAMDNNIMRYYPSNYWLRTRRSNRHLAGLEAGINYGILYFSSGSCAIRPALSLDLENALFSSSVIDEETNKSDLNVGNNAEKLTDGYSKKYTFVSDDYSLTALFSEDDITQSGANLKISNVNTTGGENQYISYILENESDGSVYYSKLADASNGYNGKISIPFSGGIEDGTYTLSLFTEKINDDLYSDFASTPITMSVSVAGGIGTISSYNGEIHTHDYNENGFCADCDGYEPAVLNNNGTAEDTSDDYYEIANAGNFYWFAEQVNSGNSSINAKLTNDITVNSGTMNANTEKGDVRAWLPIGLSPFEKGYRGVFDGQGHQISGIYCDSETVFENIDDFDPLMFMMESGIGLFGSVENATLQNFRLTNSYFVLNSTESFHFLDACMSSIIGGRGYSATVENVYSECILHNSSNETFAMISDSFASNSTIKNCIVNNTVIGENIDAWSNNNTVSSYNISTLNDKPLAKGEYGGGMYYLVADDSTDENEYAKKLSQFQSGEVAYLLGDAFGQTLNKEDYPVFGGQKVYAGYLNCGDTQRAYSNSAEELRKNSEHDYGTYRLCVYPTCTENGKIAKYCKYCNDEVAIEFDPLGHSYEYTESEDGKHTANCTRCGESHTEDCTYKNGECIKCGGKQLYTVIVENGKITEGTPKKGNIITVTANENPSETFAYWKDSDGKITSYKSSYSFVVTGDTTITAIYTENSVEKFGTVSISSVVQDFDNKKLIVKSASDVPEGFKIVFSGVLANNTKDPGTTYDYGTSNAITNGTYVRGITATTSSVCYTWTKANISFGDTWYLRAYLVYEDGNGTKHTVYGDLVKSIFDYQYEVSVTNGTGAGTYYNGDIVTIKADDAQDRMQFAGWLDNNTEKIVSYNTNYSFIVNGNCSFTAQYSAEEVEKLGTAEIKSVTKDTANNKLSFVSFCNVPEDCSIVFAGVVAKNGEDPGTDTDFGTLNAKIDNTFVRGFTTAESSASFTWTKTSVSDEDTWYVRAYLVYTDSNKETKTVFGDVVATSLNG